MIGRKSFRPESEHRILSATTTATCIGEAINSIATLSFDKEGQLSSPHRGYNKSDSDRGYNKNFLNKSSLLLLIKDTTRARSRIQH